METIYQLMLDYPEHSDYIRACAVDGDLSKIYDLLMSLD